MREDIVLEKFFWRRDDRISVRREGGGFLGCRESDRLSVVEGGRVVVEGGKVCLLVVVEGSDIMFWCVIGELLGLVRMVGGVFCLGFFELVGRGGKRIFIGSFSRGITRFFVRRLDRVEGLYIRRVWR